MTTTDPDDRDALVLRTDAPPHVVHGFLATRPTLEPQPLVYATATDTVARFSIDPHDLNGVDTIGRLVIGLIADGYYGSAQQRIGEAR